MARAALRIQDKIEKGWRKEANKLGQLWNIERNGTVVVTGYKGIVKRDEEVQMIEMDTVSFSYLLRGPRAKLQINDYLVGQETASKRQQDTTKERYLIVSMRLHRDNVLVRTDQSCKVYRPTAAQAAGNVDNSYSEFTPIENPNDLILARDTVTNQWSFVDQTQLTGKSTVIWGGITFGRAGENPNDLQVPLTTPDIGWVISMQATPGVQLREGDFVVDNTGRWYRVDRATYQDNSAVLYQLRCTMMKM